MLANQAWALLRLYIHQQILINFNSLFDEAGARIIVSRVVAFCCLEFNEYWWKVGRRSIQARNITADRKSSKVS